MKNREKMKRFYMPVIFSVYEFSLSGIRMVITVP